MRGTRVSAAGRQLRALTPREEHGEKRTADRTWGQLCWPRRTRLGPGGAAGPRRGTRGGSHWEHLYYSAREGGERGVEGATGASANPACVASRVLTRSWPRLANKRRYLLLCGVPGTKRCSGKSCATRCRLRRIYCSDSGDNVDFGIVSVCHGDCHLCTWLSYHWNCAVISGPFSQYPCLTLDGA